VPTLTSANSQTTLAPLLRENGVGGNMGRRIRTSPERIKRIGDSGVGRFAFPSSKSTARGELLEAPHADPARSAWWAAALCAVV
jgi:hypothetical protein